MGGGGAASYPFAARRGDAAPSAVETTIFTATEDLLSTTSIADLTVADVLARARVSRTTFYRYFTSKHQVVSALLEAVQAELVDVMQPWFARSGRPPAEALHEALSAVARVWARHRSVLRASSEDWHADPAIGERWVAMMDRFTEDIATAIDAERQAGAAPGGAASVDLARHLSWGSERMFYLAGFGLCGPELEQDAVDAMVAVWIGTIYRR